jgi:hypothetical protein
MKFTKKTAVLLILVSAVILAAIVIACSEPADGDISTTEGRVAYLAALGWEVDPASEEHQVIVLPREFGGVMEQYNDMQLSQGYDLTEYAGLECMLYTYKVINYPNGDPNVTAQLFVFGTRVIGGDIHSAALDGFMHGIK